MHKRGKTHAALRLKSGKAYLPARAQRRYAHQCVQFAHMGVEPAHLACMAGNLHPCAAQADQIDQKGDF